MLSPKRIRRQGVSRPYFQKKEQAYTNNFDRGGKTCAILEPAISRSTPKGIGNGQNKNKATLAVARKLVAYMLAVDKNKKDFQIIESKKAA